MIGEQELVTRIERLDVTILHQWIDLGLVAPRGEPSQYVFDDTDVARVQLICELSFDLGLGHESLPVILSLVDQLHDVRRAMRALASAIEEQPDEVRTRITARIRTTLVSGRPDEDGA